MEGIAQDRGTQTRGACACGLHRLARLLERCGHRTEVGFETLGKLVRIDLGALLLRLLHLLLHGFGRWTWVIRHGLGAELNQALGLFESGCADGANGIDVLGLASADALLDLHELRWVKVLGGSLSDRPQIGLAAGPHHEGIGGGLLDATQLKGTPHAIELGAIGTERPERIDERVLERVPLRKQASIGPHLVAHLVGRTFIVAHAEGHAALGLVLEVALDGARAQLAGRTLVAVILGHRGCTLGIGKADARQERLELSRGERRGKLGLRGHRRHRRHKKQRKHNGPRHAGQVLDHDGLLDRLTHAGYGIKVRLTSTADSIRFRFRPTRDPAVWTPEVTSE